MVWGPPWSSDWWFFRRCCVWRFRHVSTLVSELKHILVMFSSQFAMIFVEEITCWPIYTEYHDHVFSECSGWNHHETDEFRSVSEPRESVNIFRYEVGSKHILRCSTSMVACTTRISYYVCLLKAPGPILKTKPSQLALWASILQGTQ